MPNKTIENNNFRIFSAQKFLEGLLETQLSANNLYVWIGKTTPWSNETDPDQPWDTVTSRINSYNDMLAMKKVAPSDGILVIPRYDWTPGTVYAQYTDLGAVASGIYYDLYEPLTGSAPFYVITDEYNVYKCLNNNNGTVSSIKPTGTGTTILITADNYHWKFMFQVSSSNIQKFLSPLWIPIYTLINNDGSFQWAVQATATPGSIETIQVTNGGTSYISIPSVTITGDGTNCTASAVLTGTVVTSITVLTPGIGYTHATVIIGGPGNSAVAHAIISPPGGHGSNPIVELGAMYVMIDVTFNYDESGKITVNNDYRKFGLLLDPLQYGTNSNYIALIGNMTTKVTIGSITGIYNPDDSVIGQTSNATAKVVDFNNVTNVLRLIEVNGIFVVNETLTDTTSSAISTISSIANPDVQPNTGLILTTEHTIPITRGATQIEDIKISIPF
jgi:hypothetical protein